MITPDPKHIIITGETGIGKTTVCTKLIELGKTYGIRISGILGIKRADGTRMVEDIATGEREKLAVPVDNQDGMVGSGFKFMEEGIRFGNRVIEDSGKKDVVLIDEIGPLEMKGMGFSAYSTLLDSKSPARCLLIIRKKILPLFLEKHPVPFSLFEVTEANRSQLHQTILESMKTPD
jgi:nucleoside-triphosphatase THEP1